jgi:hypothetical protein
MSSTYLDRYLRGDYVEVWEELVALGADVCDVSSPVAADALAVARETMRRARYNIVLLLRRLYEVGYRFGYSWCTEDAQAFLARELTPPPPIEEAGPDIILQMDALEEAIGGPLPLSLRAWYEQVGTVNFVGTYPVDDPRDPEGFTHWQQVKAADSQQFTVAHYSTVQAQRSCQHNLDPLWIYPFAFSRDLLEGSARREWVIAPDEYYKLGEPGGGYYSILLPNMGADARVEYEWHHTMFVDYLRTCFHWGGFPGLECKRRRPEKELAFLTQDLLPL